MNILQSIASSLRDYLFPAETPAEILSKALTDNESIAEARLRNPLFEGYGGIGFNSRLDQRGLERLLGIYAGTRIDFEREAGDLSLSSLVMAAVNWLGTNLPEAPLEVVTGPAKKPNVVENHPLPQLWSQPNPYYSGELMWRAIAVSWFIAGNAYILKARNALGAPAELYYLPHYLVTPQWPTDGSEFISHYLYQVNGINYEIARQDIIHFRTGLDVNDTRVGQAPVRACMREIFTDLEATNFAAQLLKNFGIPGVIISPKGERVSIKAEDKKEIEASYQYKFGGDGRGRPLLLTGQVEVSTLSFDAEEMMLVPQRRISEERWAAVTGIPAIVLGFGAGLERGTMANFGQAREMAYESYLIPTQRLLAGDLNVQLLADFSPVPFGQTVNPYRVRFDISDVRVLQEDKDKAYARATNAWRANAMPLDEYRQLLGLLPVNGEFGKLYYNQMLGSITAENQLKMPQQDPAPGNRPPNKQPQKES